MVATKAQRVKGCWHTMAPSMGLCGLVAVEDGGDGLSNDGLGATRTGGTGQAAGA